MFNKSGERVKSIAKLSFSIIVVIVIISLIWTLIISTKIYYGGEWLFLYSVLVAAIIVFAAWVNSLFLVAFGDLVSYSEKIVALLENKHGNIIEHNDIVEYTVILSDDSECKVQISKSCGWEEIENICKNQNKQDKEIKYIIDARGCKIFKGGYLG